MFSTLYIVISSKPAQMKMTDDKSQKRSGIAKLASFWNNVTVEPVVFLSFLTSSMNAVPVQELKILKSCKLDFNFNDTVCSNLLDEAFADENDLVQDEVSCNQFLSLNCLCHNFPTFRLPSSVSTTPGSPVSFRCSPRQAARAGPSSNSFRRRQATG